MSSDGSELAATLIFLVGVAAVITLAIFALPFAIAGGVALVGAKLYFSSPKRKERVAREHTQNLYQSVLATHALSFDASDRFERLHPELRPIAEEIFEGEDISQDIPRPPPIANSIEGARYRDQLSRIASNRVDLSQARTVCDAIVKSLSSVECWLGKEGDTTVPIRHFIPDLKWAVVNLIDPLFDADVKGIKATLNENYERTAKRGSEALHPLDYKGDDVVEAYLRGTPLMDVFDIQVPFEIPENTRFEHHWIVAPPGSGKSTTLQHLIDSDLDRVADGEASVIVMESNRDLIKAIEGLARFAPGGDLEGRLILIDCEDVEYPVAINLFDVGLDDIQHASARDREALFNSAISMLDYVFRALLGAELTSRQSTLFNFSIQLLIQIKGATIDTLIDLMSVKEKDFGSYARHLDRTDADTRLFFKLKFFSQGFDDTKTRVVDRLFAIKRIRTLARMFSAPKTKLDFYKEIGQGRVILINCAKSLLQEDGVEIVSRFFLAMMLLAAEKRQLLPQSQRLPTYVYIDECQDVIRRDEKLPIILDQARKFRVAMILAHQRLDQMQPSVLNALRSTAIKFAAHVDDAALARSMNTTPEFIRNLPKFTYAAFVRGDTQTALPLKIPYIDMNRMPRMSAADNAAIVAQMRDRYARPLRAPGAVSEGDDSDPGGGGGPPDGGGGDDVIYVPPEKPPAGEWQAKFVKED